MTRELFHELVPSGCPPGDVVEKRTPSITGGSRWMDRFSRGGPPTQIPHRPGLRTTERLPEAGTLHDDVGEGWYWMKIKHQKGAPAK